MPAYMQLHVKKDLLIYVVLQGFQKFWCPENPRGILIVDLNW